MDPNNRNNHPRIKPDPLGDMVEKHVWGPLEKAFAESCTRADRKKREAEEKKKKEEEQAGNNKEDGGKNEDNKEDGNNKEDGGKDEDGKKDGDQAGNAGKNNNLLYICENLFLERRYLLLNYWTDFHM